MSYSAVRFTKTQLTCEFEQCIFDVPEDGSVMFSNGEWGALLSSCSPFRLFQD